MPSDGPRDPTPLLDGPWYLTANELLAFALEVTALACLGWWGFGADEGVLTRTALGLGLPLAGAVLWGLFAAPRARVRLPLAGVLVVKAAVLGGGAYGVHARGHSTAALVLAVVMVADTAVAETARRSASPARAA
ncbi:YrdB family protein [Streptomyces avicenniae]|uniref:YrdB family protein n=1 Tax=Streptomyces avicenniae TaxID=500153 RepID=UPI00069CB62C|nr:YrdB family protein [Streptomyces avicenniae]